MVDEAIAAVSKNGLCAWFRHLDMIVVEPKTHLTVIANEIDKPGK